MPPPFDVELLAQPFTTRQARAQGWSPDQLRGPAVRRVWHGVYVAAHVPDSLPLRAAAFLLTLPERRRTLTAFSHATAAALLGLPAGLADERLHVSVPPGQRPVKARPGVVPHETLHTDDVVSVGGLPVTCPARTWLDLAPLVGLDTLIALGDAAWRRDAAFPDAVDARLCVMAGHRGIRRVRAARPALRPGVDSPQETRVRLVVVAAGLPEPAVSADVYDSTGAWLARPDLSWPRWRIALEYEGDHHRTNRAQWRRDVGRDAALQAAGWLVIRLTAADLGRPERLVARVRTALATRSDH